MILGVLKDIKHGENRVMLTPLEVSTIIENGHKVYVQKNCGLAAGFPDESYKKAGAEIYATAKEMYDNCDFVVKVKEINPRNTICSGKGRSFIAVSILRRTRKKCRLC